ncbi:MAG: hypothetical protein WCA21_15520 [Terracidiphilus sp.]
MPVITDHKLKAELEALEKKAEAIKLRQRQIMHKASKQARAVQNNRKFIAGGIALNALLSSADFKKGFEDYFKAAVLPDDRYKFPELWPDATRPEPKPRTK